MQAIILAGGLAERIYPLATDRPKWLLPIGNSTIANYQLEWLKKNEILEVFVTVNQRLAPIVENYSYPDGIKVNFIHEEEPIGDEGGLKRALDYIEGDETYVVNCDIITDLPLQMLPAPGIALVHPRSPWGVFGEDSEFQEKPILPIWVSGGIYKFPTSIKDELVDEGTLAYNIVPRLIRDGKIGYFRYDGMWQAIETSKDLRNFKEGG